LKPYRIQIALLVAWVTFTPTLHAEAPIGYYDSATGMTGTELRSALHQIVKGHHVIHYALNFPPDTSDALRVLDANPVDTNYVIEVYNGSNALASTFGLATGWNREHQWPNSYGLDDVEPAYSDLHNLRACDANVNSSRGNKYYDTTLTNSTGYNFPAHIEAPQCSTDSDSWEPPPYDRGNIARSLFYMAIRYTGDTTNEPALHLTDNATSIQSTNSNMGRLSTLLRWNLEDPVDLAEQLRNDRVYSLYQTNRNPFVDHPEWVNLAFAPSLGLRFETTNTVVAWSGDYSGATLEAATNLPATWLAVTNSSILTNGNWQVTVPTTSTASFFRLRLR
jgi:endonuclease I